MGQGDGVAGLQAASAGEVLGNKGVLLVAADFVGVPGQGGKDGERIVGLEHVQFAGGELGGGAVEKEADLPVTADGPDPGDGEGEGLGHRIEGLKGAGHEVGGGGDEEIGADAFPDPAVDGGAEAMDHDGHAKSHPDGDGV